jgi:UDP-glucose 4-epimerase
MSNQIIITGGLGYIGSHTIVALKDLYDDFIVIDNLSNSSISVIDKLKNLTKKNIVHFNVSVNDEPALKEIFRKYNPSHVIHFAGLKSISEGELQPNKYFTTNIAGTFSLLNAIKEFECKNFIFSSSATVYGQPEYLPYDEEHPTVPINNYGRTKLIAEQLIHHWSEINRVSSLSLRYFNPVGAHQSGLIGEKATGVPNNLMPYILEVISGKLDMLYIYGDDYDTKDGTGERDYIHVVDLAEAHVSALSYTNENYINDCVNIGTGVSISVKEVINTFHKSLNVVIKHKVSKRRLGDLPKYFSKTEKAYNLLNWKSSRSIVDMCKDSLKWQQTYTKL